MSVGAVGNAMYVNQMTTSATSVQNAHNNRVELQNIVAQAAVQEKDEKVLEVRPTEENQEVDPDREHQKNEADQETKRNKKHEKKEESDNSEKPLHTLDVMV